MNRSTISACSPPYFGAALFGKQWVKVSVFAIRVIEYDGSRCDLCGTDVFSGDKTQFLCGGFPDGVVRWIDLAMFRSQSPTGIMFTYPEGIRPDDTGAGGGK